MAKKIYVSEVFAYRTADEGRDWSDTGRKAGAQGLFSVGMSVASRLNGNAEFVGSYNPDRVNTNKLWVGFVTFRKRFGDPVHNKPVPEDMEGEELAAFMERRRTAIMEAEAEALKFVIEKQRAYPVLKTLNHQEWEWGPETGETGGAEIHSVDFIDPEEREKRAAAKAKAGTQTTPVKEKEPKG